MCVLISETAIINDDVRYVSTKHGLPNVVFAWFFLLNKNACSIDNGATCFYIMF